MSLQDHNWYMVGSKSGQCKSCLRYYPYHGNCLGVEFRDFHFRCLRCPKCGSEITPHTCKPPRCIGCNGLLWYSSAWGPEARKRGWADNRDQSSAYKPLCTACYSGIRIHLLSEIIDALLGWTDSL